MACSISLAVPEDLPVLAEINRSAYSLELPSRFAHEQWRDAEYMRNFFKRRLAIRLNDASTQVFKAVIPSIERIVGFVCLTHEPVSNNVNETPTSQIVKTIPQTMNLNFIKTAGAYIEQLRGHMKGEEHYCMSARQITLS